MYRVGVVGGETHIGEVIGLRGRLVDIVGVSVKPSQVAWANTEFATEVFTDHRLMFDRVCPDIVAIANENDAKAPIVLEALERGMHVIVDKPMALTLEDVEAIDATRRRTGSRILMLLTLRGNPWYRKVKELVDEGRIGAPMQVYGRMAVELKRDQRPEWFLDKRRAGGPILDLSIHHIDQVEWVTGLKLTEVSAYESNITDPEREELIDSGAMLLRLSNGGTAILEHNRVMPPGSGSDYRLSVVGSQGQINLRPNRELSVLIEDGTQELGADDLGERVSVVEDWLTGLGTDAPVLVPDSSSIRANKVACIAKAAAAAGIGLAIPT
ncbi:MAG: Gfo/Idh/MocA family oxidoreductase [Anaerolineae bacterium]|nr:Gfo/Idh/MocA family oxidoreductase [Anaerolineae bacterium]